MRCSLDIDMSNISGVLARVFVDDLEAAMPVDQELAETATVDRSAFGDGRRLIARHPDGPIFEYIETEQAPQSQQPG